MLKLICKILGHKHLHVNGLRYCLRCGDNNFKDWKQAAVFHYKTEYERLPLQYKEIFNL